MQVLQFAAARLLDSFSIMIEWKKLPLIRELFCLLIAQGGMPFASEKKCNAPKCANTDNGVDNTGYDGAGASANPCDKVKLEKTNQTPVKTAND